MKAARQAKLAGWMRVVLLAAVAGGVVGCSSMSNLLDRGPETASTTTAQPASASGDIPPDTQKADKTEPAADLYNKGLTAMQEGSYRTAAKQFEEVERQHPYSQLATKALLMQAYSQYQRNAYDEAVNASQRFITLHPGHKDAVYAYYLMALCYYEQIIDAKRDQTNTTKALNALEEVNRRFPGTPYAQDALAKAVLARDQLAAKEMEIGRYYMKKGSYLAGINRFKKVVTDYQTTSHTPEALYRLAEGYMALGVRSEAQTATAVLGYNYPNSQWYHDAYSLLQTDGLSPTENKESWISRAWHSVSPI